jgi:hypothetical protein
VCVCVCVCVCDLVVCHWHICACITMCVSVHGSFSIISLALTLARSLARARPRARSLSRSCSRSCSLSRAPALPRSPLPPPVFFLCVGPLLVRQADGHIHPPTFRAYQVAMRVRGRERESEREREFPCRFSLGQTSTLTPSRFVSHTWHILTLHMQLESNSTNTTKLSGAVRSQGTNSQKYSLF